MEYLLHAVHDGESLLRADRSLLLKLVASNQRAHRASKAETGWWRREHTRRRRSFGILPKRVLRDDDTKFVHISSVSDLNTTERCQLEQGTRTKRFNMFFFFFFSHICIPAVGLTTTPTSGKTCH